MLQTNIPGRISRSSLALILIVLFTGTGLTGSDFGLVKGKPQQGTLAPGATNSYALSLRTGEYAQVSLETHGEILVLIVYGPSGSKIRGFKVGPQEEKLNFVTETTGMHRLEIQSADKNKRASYTITLLQVLSLGERLTAGPSQYQSPRIAALRAEVKAGRQGSVASFWNDVNKSGAPLIEPLKGDDKNMLVTFLWEGKPDTHNVLLLWWPFTGQSPNDYRLERLSGTNVWFKSLKVDKRKRFIYDFAVNAPNLPLDLDLLTPDLRNLLIAATQEDPLNPNRWAVNRSDPDAPEYLGVSAVEMPDAPLQPWLAKRAGIPSGSIERHQFTSRLLNNQREIGVYLPPGYSPRGEPYDLLFVFDLHSYLPDDEQGAIVSTPTILDNLIAERQISPTVAIFIDNVPGMRVRELGCNPTFGEFLYSELVPWVRQSYDVTTDPRRVVITGTSLGGLEAACAALSHPNTFGNVLSQSGSFWWVPKANSPGESDSTAEPDWMAKRFIESPKLPIRFYLNAGNDELDLSGKGGDILVPNRNLRDVLLAKGYEVHYEEFNGGHDYLSWREQIADGLIALMGSGSAVAPRVAAPNP
jgi:enterochelin esterase-like enzyme